MPLVRKKIPTAEVVAILWNGSNGSDLELLQGFFSSVGSNVPFTDNGDGTVTVGGSGSGTFSAGTWLAAVPVVKGRIPGIGEQLYQSWDFYYYSATSNDGIFLSS